MTSPTVTSYRRCWRAGFLHRLGRTPGARRAQTIRRGPAMPAIAFPLPAETQAAADIVERFLEASMVPDPATAALYIAPDLKITFTGGRKYGHPRETAAFNEIGRA